MSVNAVKLTVLYAYRTNDYLFREAAINTAKLIAKQAIPTIIDSIV